ncbi:type VI secretion system Vgr family protein [Chondromyces apiculatus]|uniref:VgrG protein n=1 Tax=Chondromyces apiculatus DSM 436 TaxID=1192034 RepID=A0A017T3J6_9BACT|nr:type VI secretion system tip protein TssI/VgrG [Chondromyces apiculatus]EYF03823.1 VgrG protein [Chondromyces apiculatus DSM 436]
MKEILSVRLESEAIPAGTVEIAELTGSEAISQLFSFEVLATAVGPEPLDASELVGAHATLVFERDGEEQRRVHGIIAAVRDQLDSPEMRATYRLEIAPRAFRLTLHETLDMYLDLSVPQIVAKKLELAGLRAELDFQMRFQERYPEREFVVQYKETDLAFISRLTEHLGISFFFEHVEDRDVMVFTDVNQGFRPIVGAPSAAFRERGEQQDVYVLDEVARLVPSEYVVRDYNYRTPAVDLIASKQVEGGYGGRVVEYGAHFKTPDEGETLARIRGEERAVGARVFTGQSDVQRFAAGAHFGLEGHPRGDIRLLLMEVRHHAVQPVLGQATTTEARYENQFRAIPLGLPYRPPRVTPKPRISGVLTGVIDTEEKGQYAELDEQGRYRVRFVFDTTNPGNPGERQASRPLRMIQPHSGPGYGMHFPLRHGVEVAITFIDGDPDRPIIAGTVPNPQTGSPVTRDNAARNILRTGSGNELNLDDTEGAQRIKLSTPHASTTFQLGSPNSPERGAMLTTLGAQSSVAVAGMSSVGAFGAGVSALLDYNYSGNIINVAEKPGLLQAALFAAVGTLDPLVGVLQGAFDAALNQVTYLEKKCAQDALEKSQAARRAQEKCNKCRDEAAAKLPAALKPPGDAEELTALAERMEREDLAAKDPRSFEEEQRYLLLQQKYPGAPPLTATEKARLLIATQQQAAQDLDVKWLALIGVMEDRNGIISVNRELSNPNFEVQMQADVEAARSDYDGGVTAEADALAALLALDTAGMDEDTRKQFEAFKTALSACKDCKNLKDSRDAAIGSNNAVAKQLYWSQGKSVDDPMKAEWKASDDKWVSDNYPTWKDGLSPQSLRHGKIALDTTKTAIGVGSALFSVITGLLGLFDGVRTAAELKAKWIGAGAMYTGSIPAATAKVATGLKVAASGLPPLHVLGSESSTEIFGKRDVMVWGETAALIAMGTTDVPVGKLQSVTGLGKKATVAPDTSKGNVLVMGGETASLLSPGEVDVAAGKTLFLSALKMDAKARTDLDLTAAQDLTALGGRDVKATAMRDMGLKATQDVKTSALRDISATATRNIEMTATQNVKATATQGVEISGAATAKLLSGSWSLEVSAAQGVTLGNPNASLTLSTMEAKLQSSGGSNYLRLAGSSAYLSASQITLMSQGKINLM